MSTKYQVRVQSQANYADLDPYESLAAAVVHGAIKHEGIDYIDSTAGRFWLDIMALSASAVRREGERLRL